MDKRIILQAFGEKLAGASRWVVWGVNEKKPKLPYNPRTGSPAEADNPETWGLLDEALAVMSEHGRYGLGIEFGTPGGLAGIDLDHVITSDGGITSQAREIVEAMNSYTEISPSGRGLHILFMLDSPLSDFSSKHKHPLEVCGEFEVYDSGRYFTVTGNVYGERKPIAYRTEEARKICRKIFDEEKSGHEAQRNIPVENQEMTREEAREYIKRNATEHFFRDKSGRGYICPICGSGSGKHGTGITTKDNEHFTCWAGCFKHADIFDIIGLEYGLSDYNGQFKKACELFRIDCEASAYTSNPHRQKKEAPAKYEPVQRSITPVKDLAVFIKEACGHIEETEYHRGISLETLKAYGVGYVSDWRHPKRPNAPATPRLIIPNGQHGYLARDTRENLTESDKSYAKMRFGNAEIWNIAAMYESQRPVYVVEGEIDALSVIDAGGMSVALCSTSNVNKFIEAVKDKPPEAGIILTPDNDMAGAKAVTRLEEGLKEASIPFYRHELPSHVKDANDFLMKDRQAFTAWVEEGLTACKEGLREALEREREQYERESVLSDLRDFLQTLSTSREGIAIPTGFSALDTLLDGGLYPGLYVVGAISALGKTSFCLQVADQIAERKHGVLIFSLEMSRNELIAKTLSRITRLRCNGNTENAKTTRGILRADFNPSEAELFSQAVREYSGYAGKIHITEAIGHVGTDEIRRKIEQFMKFNEGKPPVVLIDYMQILAPAYERATDKQNVDRNVTELKRISRDYQCPVIGISSFNRENYSEPVSMASFKESGAVEYSCDVLIGLQYSGMDYRSDEKDSERKRRLRDTLKEYREAMKGGGYAPIELKILKNRNGVFGAVEFEFYSKFNVFIERGNVNDDNGI